MEILTPTVQTYAWGHPSFIPTIQGRPAGADPEAELWMGAHPKAPSTVSDGRTLDVAIAQDPVGRLGESIAASFGELPFLLKILAADRALSIQTHPSATRAAEGFDRENAAGVPIDSPARSYRDPNHKPELICALTRFEAKCGFRPLEQTLKLVDLLPDIPTALSQHLRASGSQESVLADTMMWLLRDADPATVAAIIRSVSALENSIWESEIRWTSELDDQHPNDPGVVVALLMNHVVLEPGDALFLEAGMLHAYLGGAAIELMANSDNVIRGGLTPKHIDLEELAHIAVTAPTVVAPQRPEGPAHTFAAPVDEFALTRIRLADSSYSASVSGPEIIVLTDGAATVAASDGQVFDLLPGQPLFVSGTETQWEATGIATVFRATVGR